MTKKCSNCGHEWDIVKICSVCRRVAYCNKECQISHWKRHKTECAPPFLNSFHAPCVLLSTGGNCPLEVEDKNAITTKELLFHMDQPLRKVDTLKSGMVLVCQKTADDLALNYPAKRISKNNKNIRGNAVYCEFKSITKAASQTLFQK